MVRRTEILNRLLVRDSDGCTYLNSAFNKALLVVVHENGSFGFGKKIYLTDNCKVILLAINDIKQMLISISLYDYYENSFKEEFFESTDLSVDVDEYPYALVLKSMINRLQKESSVCR